VEHCRYLKFTYLIDCQARCNWNRSTYITFLMDSCQFEGADFISDVCQLVIVEHFCYGMKSKMAAIKCDVSSKAR